MSASSAVQLGTGIRATIAAIRTIVAELHAGRLPWFSVSQSVAREKLYWTPSFVQGAPPRSAESVPYTTFHISAALGNAQGNRAHKVVRTALLILELHELGALDDEDLEGICDGTDEFTSHLLKTVLLRTRKICLEQQLQAQAEEILAQV